MDMEQLKIASPTRTRFEQAHCTLSAGVHVVSAQGAGRDSRVQWYHSSETLQCHDGDAEIDNCGWRIAFLLDVFVQDYIWQLVIACKTAAQRDSSNFLHKTKATIKHW